MDIDDFPVEMNRLVELCMKIRSERVSDQNSSPVVEYNAIIEDLLDRGLTTGIDPNDMMVGDNLINLRYLKEYYRLIGRPEDAGKFGFRRRG